MKSLLAVAMLAFAGLASAEQVDLYQTGGWGALHQYHDVANSANAAITIYIGVSGSAAVYMDGDVYMGTYNGSGIPSVFTSGRGQITLTINETTRRACTYSGRGQHCSTIWTLVEGTLVR